MNGTRPVSTPTVRLTVARGKPLGKVIAVTGPSFTIGRDETCQLRPHAELVSRRHAELTITPRGVRIRDLGSRNGTLVNGRAVTAPTRLRDGDQIQIGPLTFAVSIRGVPAVAARPLSDDDVTAWLIAGEEDEAPERLADVFSGDTRVGASEASPDGSASPPPAESEPEPEPEPEPEAEDAVDEAYGLLREMSEAEE
jgi:pSer/pThr/pTyr-binding forkhead associated (FHA) protein